MTKSSESDYKYTIKDMTPKGEVSMRFCTIDALTSHRAWIVDSFGEKSIIEVVGPGLSESSGRQLLTEG